MGLGWASASSALGFLASLTLLTAFIRWELSVAEPMLPVRIFTNLRFSAASIAITSAFFAFFGFIFLVTRHFQFVRGYGLLEAGVRTVPVAGSIAAAAVLAPKNSSPGSAVNDTTRELGGTLGVAILGKVFNSLYLGSLDTGTVVR